MRRLCLLVFLVLWGCGANMPAIEVITIRPVGAGTTTELTPVGESNNWECVDDVLKNDDTDYVKTVTTGSIKTDLYDMGHPIGKGPIEKITVHVYLGESLAPNVGSVANPIIRVNGTNFSGSATAPAKLPIYGLISEEWLISPDTSLPWTWNELWDIEAGVQMTPEDPFVFGNEMRCTQVFLEITVTGDYEMINLQTQVRQVRERIGEPSLGYYNNEELTDYIRRGEIHVSQDIVDDALIELHSENSITTVDGTQSYDLGSNFLRIVDVRYDNGNGLKNCTIIDPREARMMNDQYVLEATPNNPFCWIFGGNVYVLPIPAAADEGANKLKVQYIKLPDERYKRHAGSCASPLTVSFVDTTVPKSADDFWNATSIRFTSGLFSGRDVTVTDFDDGDDKFTFAALEAAMLSTDTYDVGEVSTFPLELNPLVIAWAAYEAYLKDAEDVQVQGTLAEYNAMVEKINSRYAGHLKQERARA